MGGVGLFVLEGMPAILLGTVAFFYLTDWPRDATWLAPEQRQWIERKLEEEKPVIPKKITAWQALRSGPVLLLASVAFLEYFVAYTVAFWLPTILKRMSGFSDVRVGVLGMLPYVAGLIAMLINGWHSDKTQERRWHSAVPLFIAAAALLGLITLPAQRKCRSHFLPCCCACQDFCRYSGPCQAKFLANQRRQRAWD